MVNHALLATTAGVLRSPGHDHAQLGGHLVEALGHVLADNVQGTAARTRLGFRLDADIFRHRLGERIAVEGAVSAERLGSLYAEADLFVLASRFEGYGMAFAQAIAHGVPVIGTTAGAIPEAVPAGAGVLVQPDDVPGLVAALRRLIGDPDERARLAANARAAVLPTWEDSGKIFARVIERLS